MLGRRVRSLAAGAARAGPSGGWSAPDGERTPRSGGDDDVAIAVVLDLVQVASTSGASVPRGLSAVGGAVGGPRGAAMVTVAGRLTVGSPWDEAWRGTPSDLRHVANALGPTWLDGAPPSAALAVAAESLRRGRSARAAEAANRLGVRLVLPLGLCYLPAFVLVGIVPVLLAMASTVLGR